MNRCEWYECSPLERLFLLTCLFGIVFCGYMWQKTKHYVPVEIREVELGEPVPIESFRMPSDEEMLELEGEEPVGFAALPPRDEWMSEFRKTRREKIKTHPLCEACGRSAEDIRQNGEFGQIDMHHVISVKRIIEEKLSRQLLTDADNMIMLCRDKHGGCHFRVGHLNWSWSHSNDRVRSDAEKDFRQRYPRISYQDLVSEYQSVRLPAETVPARTSKTLVAP